MTEGRMSKTNQVFGGMTPISQNSDADPMFSLPSQICLHRLALPHPALTSECSPKGFLKSFWFLQSLLGHILAILARESDRRCFYPPPPPPGNQQSYRLPPSPNSLVSPANMRQSLPGNPLASAARESSRLCSPSSPRSHSMPYSQCQSVSRPFIGVHLLSLLPLPVDSTDAHGRPSLPPSS